ncbi:MAG: Asp23/Gls24 family envelope stress response protein [Pseudonocardiales bacterium]|nr:Asp23/Gls24 family envelope stress response protein [Pseudonocardiales bacterium]
MAVEADIESLACGRDAALVWDRAEAGLEPDDHERDCPYCLVVYADAVRLDTAIHRMAEEPVEPPASVLDAVMGAVRTELRPQGTLALESPLGPNRLAKSAAATVLRAVVDAVGGLRARSCRIEQPGPGPAVEITLTVTALFGEDLAAVTGQARRMVFAACEQVFGIPVLRVDIEVVDLWALP